MCHLSVSRLGIYNQAEPISDLFYVFKVAIYDESNTLTITLLTLVYTDNINIAWDKIPKIIHEFNRIVF